MQKIFALCFCCFLLFSCSMGKMTVRDEPEETFLARMLADKRDITSDSVLVFYRCLDEKTLEVFFLAHEITREPVFGIAINLSYDSDVLDFFSYEKGGFLEKGLDTKRKNQYIW